MRAADYRGAQLGALVSNSGSIETPSLRAHCKPAAMASSQDHESAALDRWKRVARRSPSEPRPVGLFTTPAVKPSGRRFRCGRRGDPNSNRWPSRTALSDDMEALDVLAGGRHHWLAGQSNHILYLKSKFLQTMFSVPTEHLRKGLFLLHQQSQVQITLASCFLWSAPLGPEQAREWRRSIRPNDRSRARQGFHSPDG